MSRASTDRTPWYRIPVVWVAAALLLASVIGCVVNIGVAFQYADSALGEVAPRSKFQLTPGDGDSGGS